VEVLAEGATLTSNCAKFG